MKRTLNFTFVLAILFIFACNRNSNYNSKNVDAIYPDTILPVDSPQIFAAGKISTGYFERDAAFTVDGTEFYFSVNRIPHSVILVVKKVAGIWQEPEVASFSGQFSDIEPFCSPDGNRIYFASDRPLESNSTAVKDYDIWYVEKDSAQWSAAKNAGLPLNTAANEFYPTVSKNNNLCFCALRDDSFGGEDLYFSKILPTGFSEPQNFGDSINSTANEYNAFLAPDESYIIYNSESRKFGNLCISFKINDTEWTKPIELDNTINSEGFDFCPNLSFDGKYLFFTSNRTPHKNFSATPLNYNDLKNIRENAGNGSSDIYWVKASFIDEMKKRILKL